MMKGLSKSMLKKRGLAHSTRAATTNLEMVTKKRRELDTVSQMDAPFLEVKLDDAAKPRSV